MENKENQEISQLANGEKVKRAESSSSSSTSEEEIKTTSAEVETTVEVPNESDPLLSANNTSSNVISPIEVTVEPPSSPGAKTPSRVDLALERYKEATKNWASCENQEELLKFHKSCFAQATEGHLNAEEKAQAKVKLDSYFMYILELYEEQRNVPLPGTRLSLEFTNDRISMGFFIAVGNGQDFSSSVSSRRTVTYPPNIVTSRDEIMGYILKSAKQLNSSVTKELGKEQQKVVEILQWSKKFVENAQLTFDQLLIIVPAWFQVEHSIVLRDLAHRAGFTKCYLLSDATLAAYTVLGKVSREMPTVVVVSVGILGVDIGIYTILNRALKMVALEKYEWELNDSDSEMRGCTLACIPIGRGNKIRRAMEAQGDRFQILKTSATRAADQLDEKIQQQRMETYLVSESASWVSAYQTFVEQCPNARNGSTLPENWEIAAAMKLSSSAGKIRRAIIDHVLPVDPTISIDVEVSRADTPEN